MLLWLSWLALPAAAIADDSWYAARITGGDTPLRVEHFWSKGRKVRMQTVIRAQPFVTIVNGEYYTVVDPVRNRAVAIRRSPSALKLDREGAGKRPFAREADRLIEAGAEQVGSEKIAGRASRHFRVSNRLASSEAWVTEDEYHLPMRVIRYDRANGTTRREDFVDWARDLDLPDSYFEPGSEVAVERLEYGEYAKRAEDPSAELVPILMKELLHGRD
jgi:hypothetical protein